MTAALPKSIRLRTLNALLASMVGTAPQLRSDVDAVLRVFEADDETDPRLNAADLAAAAAQIFGLLSPDRPVPTVAVAKAPNAVPLVSRHVIVPAATIVQSPAMATAVATLDTLPTKISLWARVSPPAPVTAACTNAVEAH